MKLIPRFADHPAQRATADHVHIQVRVTLILAVYPVIVVPEAFRLSGILFGLKVISRLKKDPGLPLRYSRDDGIQYWVLGLNPVAC